MNTENTGRIIAELRKEKQLTQAQLADAIHISDKAISRWETGRGFPDIDNLEALSECLNVSVAELIRGERISEPVSREEIDSITSDGMTLTRTFFEKKKYMNILLGFLLGLVIVITAVVHLMSPIYIKDPEDAFKIEDLSDGSIVAVLDENVSGYEVGDVKDPESNANLVFIGCYTTRWSQLTGKKNKTLVKLGDKRTVDRVYYYPGNGEDTPVYGSVSDKGSGGVATLPRLIYNYWMLIGAVLSFAGLIVYAVCRRKHFAKRLLRLALLPAAFTVSIPLCIFGKFDEVYNAGYYFTGILLLTVAVYLIFMIVLSFKERRTEHSLK